MNEAEEEVLQKLFNVNPLHYVGVDHNAQERAKRKRIEILQQYAAKVSQENEKLTLQLFYEEYQDELNSVFIYEPTVNEWFENMIKEQGG